jgi:hypothetical protein
MVMSDFCTEPTQFTLQLIPDSETIQSTANYYLSCSGENPTYGYIYDADFAVRWLNYYVQDYLIDSCDGISVLNSVAYDFSTISDVHITTIEELSSCQTYYKTWYDFVDQGMCTEIFGGVYIVWISQSVTALCLFICTVVAIKLIPLLEKIGTEKFRLLEEDDSSHHSIEMMGTSKL